MKYIKQNRIALLTIFSVPLLNIIYTVLNSTNRYAYNLNTVFDAKIPFITLFIIPYSLWYPFIMSTLLYLFFKERKEYYRALKSIDIGLLCCYIIYITFQTTVPRPQLIGNDILTKLVGLTYALDEPYNCFPSIHVLTSYLVIKSFYKVNIKNTLLKSIVFFMGGLIIVSTLFVKQHVILDLFSGILLGELMYYITGFINEERLLIWIKKRYLSLMMKKKLET
jgi:membrane-associated phospholipid phosphatase